MMQLDVNYLTQQGTLRPIHGANGSPYACLPGYNDRVNEFNEMGIPTVRIHDLFGVGDLDNYFDPERKHTYFQLLANTPSHVMERSKKLLSEYANLRTIFPLMYTGLCDHDIDKIWNNANFAPTDYFIKKILDNEENQNPYLQRDCIFRIGRSLDGGWYVPENFKIYTDIIERLIHRYHINYKEIGLTKPVNYWEIWNEPDLPHNWGSSPDAYYMLFISLFNKLKSKYPNIKLGGAASSAGIRDSGDYTTNFLSFTKLLSSPLDFYSWHCYAVANTDYNDITTFAKNVRKMLNQNDMHNTQSFLSEWGIYPYSGATDISSKLQSNINASFIMAVLLLLNVDEQSVDQACYYRMDDTTFGIFNAENKASYPAQCFYVYNQLFTNPEIIKVVEQSDVGLVTMITKNTINKTAAVVTTLYKPDKAYFESNSQDDEGEIYQQHYFDPSLDINELNSWYINNYFGGVDPATVKFGNIFPTTPLGNSPDYPSFSPRQTRIIQNANNYKIVIHNYYHHSSQVFRIRRGDDLSKLSPEEVTHTVNITNHFNKEKNYSEIHIVFDDYQYYDIYFIKIK
ncbi:hypothetical protein [Pseudochrobactrum sp. HB0163]|uniref:hypothetical protein n=1 Tax=Pseudochrobactrum sp. HB0163 TaxID=3450708 RepID=UPI003F6DBF34